MDAAFSPEAIRRLDEPARSDRLRELAASLRDRLSSDMAVAEFFAQSRRLVDELRSLGHDLWSFDTDGESFEIWCGDWTSAAGGRLLITFGYPREAEVTWDQRPPDSAMVPGRRD